MASQNLSIRINADLSLAKSELNKFKATVNGTQLNFGTKGVNDTTNAMKGMGKEVDSVGAKILQAGKAMSTWMILGAGISGVIRLVGGMVEEVKSLDSSLTIMSFTTNFTAQQFEDLSDSTEQMARSLGSTNSEIREATKLYSNLNSSIAEILERSEAAVVLSNIGGSAVSISDAADALLSLEQQFGMTSESANEMADVISYISATLPMDFAKGIKELSSSVQISGKLAQQAGIEYELFLSLMGRTMAVTRTTGSHVSSALKTIISRLTRVQEIGEGTEMSKISSAYRELGIEIMKDNDTFKDFGDILGLLSGKWDTLSQKNRNYLAFLTAGTRRQSEFLVMVEQFKSAQELSADAVTKNGFAMEQNEKFMLSLEGRMKMFTATLQTFSRDLMSRDFFKNVVDGATSFIKLLTDIQNSVGILNIVAASIGLINAKLIITKSIGIISFLKDMVFWLANAEAGAMSTVLGFTAMNIAMGGAVVAIGLIVGAVVLHERHQRELKEALAETTKELDKYVETSEKISFLIDRLDGVEKGTQKFYDITSQLNELLPKAAESIDSENDSIDRQIELYKELNDLKLGQALDAANEVLAETESLDELNKSLEYNQEQLDIRREKRALYNKLELDGIALSKQQATNQTKVNEVIDTYQAKVNELTTAIKGRTLAEEIVAIANGETSRAMIDATKSNESYFDSQIDMIDATDEITESMDRATSATERLTESTITLEDEIKEMSEDFKYMNKTQQAQVLGFIQGEIDKTQSLKENILTRIALYEKEISAISIVNSAVTGEEDKQVNIRLKSIINLTNQINALDIQSNKLKDSMSGLTDSITKKEKTSKVVEVLNEQALALREINHQLAIQETIVKSSKGTDTEIEEILKLNELLLAKKEALHQVNEENRKLLENSKLTVKEQQDLQDEINSTGEEWWKVDDAMKSNIKTIEDIGIEAIKKQNTILKEQADLLKDVNSEYEKETELISKNLKRAIEDEIDLREDALESELELKQDIIDSRQDDIDLVNDEIDALKTKNELLDNQAKREQLLLDLANAKKNLASLERNTLIFSGTGFEWGRNPQEVAKAEEEIANTQAKLTEHDVEMSKKAEFYKLEAKKKALQDSKQLLEDEMDAFEEAENDKIELVKNALSEITDITSLELGKQNEAWQLWSDNNKEILGSLATEVNSMISSMAQLRAYQLSNLETIGGIEAKTETNKTDVFDAQDEARLANLKSGASVNALSEGERNELNDLLKSKALSPIPIDGASSLLNGSSAGGLTSNLSTASNGKNATKKLATSNTSSVSSDNSISISNLILKTNNPKNMFDQIRGYQPLMG